MRAAPGSSMMLWRGSTKGGAKMPTRSAYALTVRNRIPAGAQRPALILASGSPECILGG